MTRINVISPGMLHPKHILAEYRELPRVFGLVDKLHRHGVRPHSLDIPQEYVLGRGHVRFFYTRLKYLCDRQYAIVEILKSRGVNITYTQSLAESFSDLVDTAWWGDYTPSEAAIQANLDRLRERMPLFYTSINNPIMGA